MRNEISRRAAELRAAGVPYVHARVVLAERPTSARPGDEALVLGDGTLEGFVGGTCAESTVRSRGLALLDSGQTELLRIAPHAGSDGSSDGSSDGPGRVLVHNPCLSGGALELFLEPVLPAPLVLVVGATPIGTALLRFADALGYDVRAAGVPGVTEPPGVADLAGAAAVVVASHGRDEPEVLGAALQADVGYIGLVASPKRGAAVLEALADRLGGPVPPGRISTPAGLDLGARTPEEIALSILAEVVASRPRPAGRPVTVEDGPPAATAVDPVCGMTVAAVDATLHLDLPAPIGAGDGSAGEVVRAWFCGSGCLRAFAAEPAAYSS